MKPFILILLVISFASCKETLAEKNTTKDYTVEEKTRVIEDIEVSKKELILNQIEGKWYYKNQPYNGYSVKFHSNGTLEERLGFFKGKREGVAKRWSKNGVLRVQSYYNQNKLVGVYKSWWENGTLGEESNYINGLKQGIEKQWHSNGQLAKLRHLKDGKENGMQQAWLKNGKLYVNYEAKNGRIFGLMRSNLCYQLKDEVVVRSRKN
ncbi:hypothetical protein Q4Q35_12800 [Flavivirga aquimarina]|uniref:Toxin-antitoxin system YwqK family antitoxin n=1 Tax=Flavivirga aquimarina TaxID=2027862 RepID=A0ABT8WCB7_9FLAO|nr:hypothetical protein [Flavivirga aquimarina]MDO5970689.1 hypothetical protein [Flavivirga aquimarina]